MQRYVLATVSIVCFGLGGDASAQRLEWSTEYGGGEGTPDTRPAGPPATAESPAGDIYSISHAFNGTDVGVLTKYSAAGQLHWTRILREGAPLGVVANRTGPTVLTAYRTLGFDALGGTAWSVDHMVEGRPLAATSIATHETSVIVAGILPTESIPRTTELALLRIDPSGAIAWARSFPTPGSAIYTLDGFGLDLAGRAYATGRGRRSPDATSIEVFMAAFGPEGAQLWFRWFESSIPTEPAVLAVSASGGAYLSLPGGFLEDAVNVRLDSAGNVVRTFLSLVTFVGRSAPRGAVALEDGGLLLVGATLSQDMFIVRHDASGAPSWGVVRTGYWGGGPVLDTGGRAVVTWSDRFVGGRATAYQDSGSATWETDLSGWPGDIRASASGRVLVAVGRSDGGVGIHGTVALDTAGAIAFVASPGKVASADWARGAKLDDRGNTLLLAIGFDAGWQDRILKLDPAGGLAWAVDPFPDGDPHAVIFDFAIGPDGESVAIESTARVARLDANGLVTWLATDLFPPQYEFGGATSTVIDAAGAVYVAGWVWGIEETPRHFISKYARDGQLLWRRLDMTQSAYVDWPVLLATVPGGRVALAGTVVDAQIRVWVVDADGGDAWLAALPGPSGLRPTALVVDSAGSLLVGTSEPGRTCKLGPAGALLFCQASSDGYGWGVNAISVEDGGAVAVAYAAPSCLLDRLSPDGIRQWDKVASYPTAPSYCATLQPRPAGGFFVAGIYFDDIAFAWRGYVAAYDATGQVVWNRASGPPGSGPSALHLMAADRSGRVVVAGYSYRVKSDFDALIQSVVDEPRPTLRFHVVPPCRAVDTRDAGLGGPAPVGASTQADVRLVGTCGVPETARAVALNVTAVDPSSAGHFTAFPAGRVPPLASMLSHGAGGARASQVVLELGDDGMVSLRAIQPSGTVHVLVDVAGYFE